MKKLPIFNYQFSKNVERGQSLFEVVVAIAISALVIIALVALVTNAIQNATFSRNKNQAALYSQAGTEWLRTQRDTDISTFIANAATPSWCLASLSWGQPGACSSSNLISGTIFTRQVNFSVTQNASSKTVIEADVVVSWTDSKGIHIVKNATSFTDWRQR